MLILITTVTIIIFQTYLVSGGQSGSNPDGSALSDGDSLSSTELYMVPSYGPGAWINGGSLSSPRSGLRGANIDNKVFMIGKHEQSGDLSIF